MSFPPEDRDVRQESTLDSLIAVITTVPEPGLVACYEYCLSMESLGRVAHPTSDCVAGNKILELQARSVTSQHLSVPLKVVQTIIGVLPPKVLAVLTKDPLKFFGLAALCKQNFDLLGGSGDFLSKVIREMEGGITPKAPKISLVETWHTPDDLLEPLRLLIGVVLLSNVTYGLCLLGLLGVACRQFTDLRQQELLKGNGSPAQTCASGYEIRGNYSTCPPLLMFDS